MSSLLTISAQVLGHGFSEDPEFRLPQHPRLVPEVLALPYGAQALLFEGVRDTQVVAGRSARTFIPRLMEALDGQHTLEMLQERFAPVPPDAVHDAVVLLFTRGLLEDGPEDPVAQNRALSAFAGRYCDVTRANTSRNQALGRLAAARVAVVNNAGGRHVLDALGGYGFAALELLDSPHQMKDAGHDLLVAVFSGEAPDAAEWMAMAQRRGLRTLHAHIGQDKVEVGPYFIPGVSGCYDCMRTLEPVPAGADAPDLGFWAGVTAQHAGNLVSRLGPVKLYNTCRVHRRGEHGPIFEKRTQARLPGCRACGMEAAEIAPQHPDVQTWVRHQAAHVMVCKELRSPRDHQIHYAAANIKLTSKVPAARYGTEQVPLPGDVPLTLPPGWSDAAEPRQRVDLPLLAQVLQYAAGYQSTPGGPRRIAPSGGGLASSELFVIARKLPGLNAGAYHYFGYEHRLEWIGWVEDSLLAGALGVLETELPPVVIVGTSDMRKTRQKYDEFSFRIGVLDGGVVRQYLQEVAEAAGVRVEEFADLRDKVVAHLLNLATSGNRSMLTFAIGIGDSHIPGEAPNALENHYQSPDAIIEMCGRMGSARSPVARSASPTVAAHSVRSLGELMLSRRSHRRFGNRPMSAATVASVAALAAHAGVRRDESSGLCLPMKLWVVVFRPADDLPAGVYRWNTEQGTLERVRAGVTHEQLLASMQQHGYAEAAITCFVTGDFDHALRNYGARGYRELASRAGSMLARAQLAAMSWGAVGSMWGGVAEEGVGELLQVDRYRDCPMFAASFGYPADA